MNKTLLAAAALALAPTAHAQVKAVLKGIDVYRSARWGEAEVKQRFTERLNKYVSLRNDHMPNTDKLAELLRLQIQKEVAARPGVAFAEVRFSEYFTSAEHAMYAVFDIVDASDAGVRMAFSRPPKGRFPDPGNILYGWRYYMSLGERLSARGEMSLDRPNCPGFFCLWSGTPEIEQLQAQFKTVAVGHPDELRHVLMGDQDGEKRADALFVLSYSTAGRTVVNYCHDALIDPDQRVRGAGLQILADIANHHQDLTIALDRVLARLDDPVATVRGKALGLLVALAEREAYRQVMVAAAPRMVILLKLHQPESRDLAFTLLGLISRKNFDRADFASWDAWAQHPTLDAAPAQ